jgi:hypothetical protein
MDTPAAEKALADGKLYSAIIAHRESYNTMRGFDYATLATKTINFIPPANLMAAYHSDYAVMREQMIYGNPLTPAELFERIKTLNERFGNTEFSSSSKEI